MRSNYVTLLAMLASAASSPVYGDDLQSGLPVGKTMLSMPIEKIAGVDDGVNPGQTICYT